MKSGPSICLACFINLFSTPVQPNERPGKDQLLIGYDQNRPFPPQSPISSNPWTSFPFRKYSRILTCPVPRPSSAASPSRISTSSKPSSNPSPSPSIQTPDKDNPLPRLLSFSEWKEKEKNAQPYRKQKKAEHPQANSQPATNPSPPIENPDLDRRVAPSPKNLTTQQISTDAPKRDQNQIQRRRNQDYEDANTLENERPRPGLKRFWKFKPKIFSDPSSSIEFEYDPSALNLSNASSRPPSPELIPELESDRSNLSLSSTQNSVHNPIHQHEAFYHPDLNAGTGDPQDPLKILSSRTNYASFDCSASIHRSSKSSKSASSILNEKKDKYMLTPCRPKKSKSKIWKKKGAEEAAAEPINFVIFELCDEIEIDTVVLANFEFFSSMFKLIRISVSSGGLEGASGVDWVNVGLFRTRNVRGLQVFPIKNLQGFYRYVRLDFLSHYGSEYYCPLSLVRIYGLTQIDAFRRDQEVERRKIESLDGQEDDETPTEEEEVLTTTADDKSNEEAAANDTVLMDNSGQLAQGREDELDSAKNPDGLPSDLVVEVSSPKSKPVEGSSDFNELDPSADPGRQVVHSQPQVINQPVGSQDNLDQTENLSQQKNAPDQGASPTPENHQPEPVQLEETQESLPPTTSKNKIPEVSGNVPSAQTEPPSAPVSESTSPSPAPPVHPNPSSSTHDQVNQSEPLAEKPQLAVTNEPLADAKVEKTAATQGSPATPPSSEPSNPTQKEGKKTPPVSSNPDPPRPPTSSKPSNGEKALTGATGGSQGSESIFGQIMKRLNHLDSNHDLALKYVEEQSKLLESSLRLLDQRLLEFESRLNTQESNYRQSFHDLNELKVKLTVERNLLNRQIESLDSSMAFIKSFGLVQFASILAVLMFLALTRFQQTSVSPSPNTIRRPRALNNLRLEPHKSRPSPMKTSLGSKSRAISGKENGLTQRKNLHMSSNRPSYHGPLPLSAFGRAPPKPNEAEFSRESTPLSCPQGSGVFTTTRMVTRDGSPSLVAQGKMRNQNIRDKVLPSLHHELSSYQSYEESNITDPNPQSQSTSRSQNRSSRLRSSSDSVGSSSRPMVDSTTQNTQRGGQVRIYDQKLFSNMNKNSTHYLESIDPERYLIDCRAIGHRSEISRLSRKAYGGGDIHDDSVELSRSWSSKTIINSNRNGPKKNDPIGSGGKWRMREREFEYDLNDKRHRQARQNHQRSESMGSHSEWTTECSGNSSVGDEDEGSKLVSSLGMLGEDDRMRSLDERLKLEKQRKETISKSDRDDDDDDDDDDDEKRDLKGLDVSPRCEIKIEDEEKIKSNGNKNDDCNEVGGKSSMINCLPPSYRSAVKVAQ